VQYGGVCASFVSYSVIYVSDASFGLKRILFGKVTIVRPFVSLEVKTTPTRQPRVFCWKTYSEIGRSVMQISTLSADNPFVKIANTF
jgi:hypothetical protein